MQQPFNIVLDNVDKLIDNIDQPDFLTIENLIKKETTYMLLDTDEIYVIDEHIKEKVQKKLANNTNIKNNKQFKPFTDENDNLMMVNASNVIVTEGEAMSSLTSAVIIEKIPQEEFDRRSAIFEKIRAIVLPEQRSPEWFAMRSGKITASDGGAVLGQNKYEPQYNFILKKVFGSTFETNDACYHGKKFENAVTLMYELSNDVVTEEFGLLGHPEYYFLGASPDGICAPYCRDKVTPNQLVGRMLEIKCPLMRKIKYSGNIKETICPIYYWCQVQLQLECCELEECDFIQCKIEEYDSRSEWLEDTGNKSYIGKQYGKERGILLELLPTKLEDCDYTGSYIKKTTVYDKASFVYPPKIDMTQAELDNWILNELAKIQETNTTRLHRVVYWRLVERNCTLILRDKEWFNNNLEKLRTMWGYVEYLRNNMEIAEEWKLWMEGLSKKYNDKVLAKLKELIDNKQNKNAVTSEQIIIEDAPKPKKKSNKSKT
jgi:putative phage-type endonuclease